MSMSRLTQAGANRLEQAVATAFGFCMAPAFATRPDLEVGDFPRHSMPHSCVKAHRVTEISRDRGRWLTATAKMVAQNRGR